MVNCSAVGCTNTTTKGFKLCRFPSDKHRRKIWLIKTKRAHWKPTDNSYLCEVHFDENSWEKIRVDGKKKLKATAVPTIFSYTKPSPSIAKRKPPKERQFVSSTTTKRKTSDAESQQTNNRESMVDTIIQCSDEVPEVAPVIESCTSLCEEHSYSDAGKTIRVDGEKKLKQTALPTIISFTKPATNVVKRTLPKGRQFVSSSTTKSKTSDAESQQTHDRESQCDDASFQCSDEIPEVSQIVECATTVSQDTENMQPFKDGDLKQSSAAQNAIQELKEKVERLKNMYLNEFLRAEAFQKKCKDLAKELDKTKQSPAEKTDELLILKQVFKDDQVKLMKNRAMRQGDAEVALCHQWSNDTIAQAVRLRQSCGNAGYEQLIKAGFPFPSIRTLQRYLKSL